MKHAIRVVVLAGMLACSGVHAAGDAGFRIQPGLTGASGLSDLRSAIQDNNPFLSMKQLTSVGLSFGVAYGFNDTLALGLSVGPIAAATGDVDFTIVPVALDLRVRLGHSEGFGTYARLGAEKASVSGDLISSGSVGGVLGLGIDFGKSGSGGFGIEAAYHSTQVKVNATPGHAEKKVQPYKATVTVYYAF
jgi:hypothetical protein